MKILDFASLKIINDSGGRISLPHWVRRVKIDVGLSGNAPNSRVWLEHDSDLFVIGIEPNRRNLLNIVTGLSGYTNRIDWDRYKSCMYILPYAVSNLPDGSKTIFFCTEGDGGQSSILEPITFGINSKYEIRTIRLATLIQGLTNGTNIFIEHIKTDCQGYDLEVLISAKECLERVGAYTFEYEPNHYNGATKDFRKYDRILREAGFVVATSENVTGLGLDLGAIQTEDPTYINTRLVDKMLSFKSMIYQYG